MNNVYDFFCLVINVGFKGSCKYQLLSRHVHRVSIRNNETVCITAISNVSNVCFNDFLIGE